MEKLEKFQILISCLFITLALLISSFIFASKIQNGESITVTGSAFKIVKSDSAKLNFNLNARATNQKTTYAIIKKQLPIVINYLKEQGIEEKNITIKTINGYEIYKQNDRGYSTQEIIAHSANQGLEITSNDVEKIKNLSINLQDLINQGINIEVFQPEYFYSDLASIKIDLLKEATEDAKDRATSMLKATKARVGKVKSMRMGVFQITPVDSNSVSNMGINDTSSIDNKVTAVANVVFKVK